MSTSPLRLIDVRLPSDPIDDGPEDVARSDWRQSALQITIPAPAGVSLPRHLTLVGSRTWNDQIGPEEPTDPFFDRQPSTDADLPEPIAWTNRIVQALLEVSDGRRPAHQISRWVNHSITQQFRPTPVPPVTRQEPSRIIRVRVTRPGQGVVEASATVYRHGRTRAMALRLEGWDGRWICTIADLI